MDPKTFQRIVIDPAEFRRRLRIDVSGQAVPFQPDEWQTDDFTVLDPGWQLAAGRFTGTEPPIRRAWLERPRGHSKSADLGIGATWALLSAMRAIRGIGAAADKEQARLLRDAIERLCQLNPWIGSVLKIQSWIVENTRTGSTLEIISSDAATSYGALPDFIICDEVSHWKNDALWVSLLSAAAKRSNCLLAVIMNAGFKESWVWKVREAIRTDSGWHFHSLPGPVASWISPAALEEQRRLLPGVAYDRLWLNQWSSGSGDALDPQDVQRAIVLDGPMEEPDPECAFYAGLDLGISRDRSALVVVGLNGAGKLKLASVRSWRPFRSAEGRRKIELAEVEDAVLAAHHKFGLTRLFADQYQAEQMCQSLAKAGVPVEVLSFTMGSLQEMATVLLESFADARVQLFEDSELVADLGRLRLVDRGTSYRLDAARDSTGHADTAIAFVLALLAAKRHPSAPSGGEPMVLTDGWTNPGRFNSTWGILDTYRRLFDH